MKLKYLTCLILPFILNACQSGDLQKIGSTTVNMLQQHQTANETLISYEWSYFPQNSKNPITLNFNKNLLNINAGCNHQGGSWKIEKGLLSVNDLMSNMMMCSNELMQQEKFAGSLFNKRKVPFVIDKQNIEQPTLTIISSTGEKIIFTGKMKPEIKYQTQAETIFLEIAPDTKNCSTGTMQKQCLQIREVKYADNGVKLKNDTSWTNFYDEIEGFKHDSRLRQIVRIKRYEIKNPAADQSKYVFIKDMIVESEVVTK